MSTHSHHTSGPDAGPAAGPVPDGPGTLVPITIRYDRHTVTVPGQGTGCPHLVVVPLVDGDRYCGFTVAHRPTGRYLGMPGRALTADQAAEVADQLGALDWVHPGREFYDTDDHPHRRAWYTAIRAQLGRDPR